MFTLRVLHAPKEGNTEEQYEDAYAHTPVDESACLTVALADGASSAFFAREWANLLTTTFATPDGLPATDAEAFAQIATLGKTWNEKVSGRAIKWYDQEKLASGSSAALLVVRFDSDAKRLKATCVGDACLFIVRGDKLRYGFPVTKSRAFTDRPDLLTTSEPVKPPKIVRWEAPMEPGDRYFLLTDALAAWFLTRHESRNKAWDELPQSEAVLAKWLKERRDKATLKNDDVTLIEIRFT